MSDSTMLLSKSVSCQNEELEKIVLVVEHDVGKPNILSRNVQVLDVAVVLGVPLELVVDPFLENKQQEQFILRHWKARSIPLNY